MTNNETTNELAEAKALAISLAPEVIQNSKDINELHAAAQSPYAFRAHYANFQTGDTGNKPLMIAILKEQQAVFPRNAESTPLRPVVVATALFASEILACKEAIFGPNRYPGNTIQCDLGTLRRKGIVASVKLSPSEDFNRPSGAQGKIKPRLKWYLVETKENANIALAQTGVTVDIGTDSDNV